MDKSQTSTSSNRGLLMLIAFSGIFLYGLLAALPGSVLPTLERNQFLPNDNAVGTFLLINAVGAVIAYLISGPLIDRIGKKFSLSFGTAVVVLSMIGFAMTVTRIPPTSALVFLFIASFVLGLGANAIVAAGHALVADVAAGWRNAALNLLDICFGLGLASLPLVVQTLQKRGGLELIFWSLGVLATIILILVLASRVQHSAHSETVSIGEARSLFTNPSFLLLASALFMYVGAEVSVGKWVVAFMQRDSRILTSQGLNESQLRSMTSMTPESLSKFFEVDALGYAIATYALTTLTLFAMALLVGRLISSILLGLFRINSFVLMTVGSLITAASLLIAFTAGSSATVRVALIAAGFGMGPIFPTSVGLASVMMPQVAGTAMSLAMGIGFAGLLIIPPAVGYVSSAVGGPGGDVRSGLTVVVVASVLMFVLHLVLMFRERKKLN